MTHQDKIKIGDMFKDVIDGELIIVVSQASPGYLVNTKIKRVFNIYGITPPTGTKYKEGYFPHRRRQCKEESLLFTSSRLLATGRWIKI